MKTTTFTGFSGLTEEHFHSEETAKTGKGLQAKIDALQAAQAEFNRKVEKYVSTPVEELTDKTIADGGKLRFEKIRLLRDEIDIRHELAAWLVCHRNDALEARSAAWKAVKDANETVRHELVEIGFTEPLHERSAEGSYMPQWVERHLTVQQANTEANRVHKIGTNHEWLDMNQKAIDDTTARVNAERESVLSI